ncbi:hypothetical protein BH11PLA2_BH11PLA2_34350 [soil metagenome]
MLSEVIQRGFFAVGTEIFRDPRAGTADIVVASILFSAPADPALRNALRFRVLTQITPVRDGKLTDREPAIGSGISPAGERGFRFHFDALIAHDDQCSV